MRRYTATAALATLLTGTAGAADPGAGRALHDAHCIACHSALTGGEPSRIYTRPDRTVGSRDALTARVRHCEQALDLGWSDREVESVAAWLNATHYGF